MGRFHNNKGINKNQLSSQIRGIELEKILVVPIDAAKLYQKACITNYYGDILVTPFFFSVDLTGIQFLVSHIRQTIKLVDAAKVFVGIEATGHYYEDIVRILRLEGFTVYILNPIVTDQLRKQTLSSSKTDDLDLLLIQQAIISNKAHETVLQTGLHKELLVLTRARRSEINKRSKLKTTIRMYLDSIFREFQMAPVYKNGKLHSQKIFSDLWGKSAMFLMNYYPHPSQILKLGENGLRTLSKEHNLKLRQSTIDKLLDAASNSLSKPLEELSSECFMLNLQLKEYDYLTVVIRDIETKIKDTLLKTDGALLLTIPGVGLTLAAELFAELGDLSTYSNASQLIKKAGTNPVIKQSGSSHYQGSISKQGNRHLRQVIYTIGRCVSLHNTDLNEFFCRLDDKGKHKKKIFIAMGNKVLKIVFAMLKKRQPFQSKSTSFSYKKEIEKKLLVA